MRTAFIGVCDTRRQPLFCTIVSIVCNMLRHIVEQELLSALGRFSCYHHIWREDREDAMQKYNAAILKPFFNSPTL